MKLDGLSIPARFSVPVSFKKNIIVEHYLCLGGMEKLFNNNGQDVSCINPYNSYQGIKFVGLKRGKKNSFVQVKFNRIKEGLQANWYKCYYKTN